MSVPFAVGQLTANCGGQPPGPFWSLYALYVALAASSSVVWALRTTPDEGGEMVARIDRVAEDHGACAWPRPRWFPPG